jgi:anti-anti-sigma factor
VPSSTPGEREEPVKLKTTRVAARCASERGDSRRSGAHHRLAPITGTEIAMTTIPPPELSPPDPRHSSGVTRLSPTATPTAARLHGRVLRRNVAGDSADHRREKPVCEPSGERSRLRSWAVGADEPELVDLVRLHKPTPDAVIVRVSGTVDRRGALLLAELARKQLNRAPHVVIDLSNVSTLGPRGVAVLLMLHKEAVARGTDLRVVGAEHDAVHRPLQVTGLTQLLRLDSTADAVIATLPTHQVRRRPPNIRASPHAGDPAGNHRDRQSVEGGFYRSSCRPAGDGPLVEWRPPNCRPL